MKKKPGWLFDIGEKIYYQVIYRDYHKPFSRSLLPKQYFMKSRANFFDPGSPKTNFSTGGGGQPWRVVINISVVTTRAEVPQVAPTFGELFGVPQVPRGRGR